MLIEPVPGFKPACSQLFHEFLILLLLGGIVSSVGQSGQDHRQAGLEIQLGGASVNVPASGELRFAGKALGYLLQGLLIALIGSEHRHLVACRAAVGEHALQALRRPAVQIQGGQLLSLLPYLGEVFRGIVRALTLLGDDEKEACIHGGFGGGRGRSLSPGQVFLQAQVPAAEIFRRTMTHIAKQVLQAVYAGDLFLVRGESLYEAEAGAVFLQPAQGLLPGRLFLLGLAAIGSRVIVAGGTAFQQHGQAGLPLPAYWAPGALCPVGHLHVPIHGLQVVIAGVGHAHFHLVAR